MNENDDVRPFDAPPVRSYGQLQTERLDDGEPLFEDVDPTDPPDTDASQPPDREPPDRGASRHPGRDPRASSDRPSTQSGSDEPGGEFAASNATHPISMVEIFDLLSDDRRRALVDVLCESDRERSVESLATEVARREGGETGTPGSTAGGNPDSTAGNSAAGVSESARRSIAISLVHNHLPRLASMNLVRYDRDRRKAKPTPVFRRLESQFATLLEAGASLPDET